MFGRLTALTVMRSREGDLRVVDPQQETHDNTVVKIANRSFGALEGFAGDAVTLTDDVKGDTVTVTKIEKAK